MYLINNIDYDKSTAKEIWKSFTQGESIDLTKLPDTIRRSWIRSKKYKIDTKKLFQYESFDIKTLKYNELYCFILDNYDMLESFVKVAAINNLSISVYDIRNKSLFNILGDTYLNFDLSETNIGTNAVSLAVIEASPMIVLKYQHYHERLNDAHCIAAPFRDEEGELVGAIFAHVSNDEALSLSYSIITGIANVLDNSVDYKEKEYMYEQKYSTLSKRTILPEIKKGSFLYTFDNIRGQNKKILELKEKAKIVACSNVPVLIYGESGSGKEVLAQAIHQESNRNKGPFVAINCGAIPENLVESELFGYEPGSFTGASKNGKKGLLEIASSGTVFLDEIESMPLHIQIKLLRTLSTNRIMKIGGMKAIHIDIRIISATKKNLLIEADQGNFREDLYYRISTAKLEIPPLRDRTDDIPLLLEYIIKQYQGKDKSFKRTIDDEFINALGYYYWRGNIRELENVIEWALLMSSNDKVLKLEHLPDTIIKAYQFKKSQHVLRTARENVNAQTGLLKIMEEIMIEDILKETDYHMEKTADKLGISRKTLYSKIQNSPKLCLLKSNKH